MEPTSRHALYVWLALALLVALSWLGAESKLLVAALASAKFLGIFWFFMEMKDAHRAWLGLAGGVVALWFGATLLL